MVVLQMPESCDGAVTYTVAWESLQGELRVMGEACVGFAFRKKGPVEESRGMTSLLGTLVPEASSCIQLPSRMGP